VLHARGKDPISQDQIHLHSFFLSTIKTAPSQLAVN